MSLKDKIRLTTGKFGGTLERCGINVSNAERRKGEVYCKREVYHGGEVYHKREVYQGKEVYH